MPLLARSSDFGLALNSRSRFGLILVGTVALLGVLNLAKALYYGDFAAYLGITVAVVALVAIRFVKEAAGLTALTIAAGLCFVFFFTFGLVSPGGYWIIGEKTTVSQRIVFGVPFVERVVYLPKRFSLEQSLETRVNVPDGTGTQVVFYLTTSEMQLDTSNPNLEADLVSIAQTANPEGTLHELVIKSIKERALGSFAPLWFASFVSDGQPWAQFSPVFTRTLADDVLHTTPVIWPHPQVRMVGFHREPILPSS